MREKRAGTIKRYAAIAAALILAGSAGCSNSRQNGDGTKEETLESFGIKPEKASESQSQSPSHEKERQVLIFENSAAISGKLLEQCQEYGAAAEHYLNSASFGPADSKQVKALTELLSGHYEVAGRRDENGREYYLAARRLDAPEYDDFISLSIGYVQADDSSVQICQIGYDDNNGNENILYQLPEYWAEFSGDMETSDVLDCFCFVPLEACGDRAFLNAFSEKGRMELDFLQKHPGLSFPEEGQSCISCYYQDEDTIQFFSQPYECIIPLAQNEAETLEALLKEGQGQESHMFDNEGQAISWLQKQNPSLRTTGAKLILGDNCYRLLGCREQGGYLMAYGPQSAAVECHEPVYSYVMDRIKEVMGRDYKTFTNIWFDTPLAEASLDFPRLEEREDGKLAFRTVSQTITEPEKLKQLSQILGNAIRGHEAVSGCPYKGVLNLVREDGETLQMFLAADSCDSIMYEGRIGFEYGRQKDMAEIFDKAMK